MVAHYVVALHNGEGEVGQAEGVGRNEGEGEPDQPAGDETPHAVRGLGCRTQLPERLVNKYKSECAWKKIMWRRDSK